jgi:hypothetical protein
MYVHGYMPWEATEEDASAERRQAAEEEEAEARSGGQRSMLHIDYISCPIGSRLLVSRLLFSSFPRLLPPTR